MNSVANTKKKKKNLVFIKDRICPTSVEQCSRSSAQNNKNTLAWKQINTNIYIIKELDSKSYVP